jgi:hypothetical protein
MTSLGHVRLRYSRTANMANIRFPSRVKVSMSRFVMTFLKARQASRGQGLASELGQLQLWTVALSNPPPLSSSRAQGYQLIFS